MLFREPGEPFPLRTVATLARTARPVNTFSENMYIYLVHFSTFPEKGW